MPMDASRRRVFHVLGVDRGLIARPFAEEAVLRAGGLDGLRHADARQGGGGQLALVPHLHPGQVDPLPGKIPGHPDVQDQGGQADQGQHQAVAQHQHQVEHHHDGVQQQRRDGLHQRAGDGGVGGLALEDVAHHALGEELHGQAQHLPHVGGVADDGQLAVDLQRIHRPRPLHHQLQRAQQRHQRDEGVQPPRAPAPSAAGRRIPGTWRG